VSEVRFVSDLTEVDLERELDPDNVGPPLVIPAQANDSRWSKLGQKLANLDDPEALAKERAAKAQAAALQLNCASTLSWGVVHLGLPSFVPPDVMMCMEHT
jgi:hypothetical protein